VPGRIRINSKGQILAQALLFIFAV